MGISTNFLIHTEIRNPFLFDFKRIDFMYNSLQQKLTISLRIKQEKRYNKRKKGEKRKMKKSEGITLIALVVTIVILIILAGISIRLVLGENGIVTKSKESKKQMKIAEYIDKVELSRGEIAIENLGNITLEDVVKQIYKDKIVPKGNITKLEDNKSAKMLTKEGYIFIITQDTVEYIGNSNEEATVKEAKMIANTTDGIVTLTIKAGMPGEIIQKIELYEEDKGKIENLVIPTGMSKIQKEKAIELPFYEEIDRVYYIKVIGNATTLESEKVKIEKNTNTIRTANDLKRFATLVNNGEKFKGQTINQVENINLSEICNSNVGSWEPIGYIVGGNLEEANYFDGKYNGNGRQINNLYINEKNREIQIGLFGILGYNGIIENLTVQGEVTSQEENKSLAGIVGRNDGIIENCVNMVEVNSINNTAGGITGFNNGSVKKCINKSNIYGEYCAGGIASSNQKVEVIQNDIPNTIRYPEIIECTNEGNITANGYIAGGIVGKNTEKIENCKNTGTVKTQAQLDTSTTGSGTGGIAGETTANIVNCSNRGWIKADWSWAGGITGHAGENVKIDKCYNENGIIETLNYSAGGIVGRIESGTIENSYNISLGESYIKAGVGNAGGIAATCKINLLVKNCYSIGNNIQSEESSSYKGSIVGAIQNNETSIENCYYEKGTSLEIVFLDGYTLKKNTAIEKELSEFKLNARNENSVTYALNNYINSEIWGQEASINGGYPYLLESKER